MHSKNLLYIFLIVCSIGSISLAWSIIFATSLFLPFILVMSIIAAILLFKQPLAFLSALFFIRMLTDYFSQNTSINLFGLSISLSQMIGLGIAVFGIPFLFKYRALLRSFKLVTPFAIFFAWGISSLLFSIEPEKTLQDLIRIFDIFTVSFLAFVSIKNRREFQAFLIVVLLSSLIPIITGITQFILGIGLKDDSVQVARIFGTFSHPNVYSLYLFSVVVCSILFLVINSQTPAKRSFKTYLGVFIVTAGSIALVLTFARVSWVTLFFFLTALSAWKYPKFIFPLILFPFIVFSFSATLQERVTQTFNQSSNSSVSWRTVIWDDMIQRTLNEDREWYGYGLETFPKAAERLRGVQFGSNEAHNDYVKFFVEGGFIGLAFFLTYLMSIFFVMQKRYSTARDSDIKTIFAILIVFFLSIMIASLSDNIFKNTPLWWVFFSLLGGALALKDTQISHPQHTISQSSSKQ